MSSSATLIARPVRGSQEPRFLSLPPGKPDRPGDFADRAVQLADLAGLNLDPWQQLTLRSMLRTAPASNQWAAYESLILVPRQNGKSVTLEAYDLAKLFLSPPGHMVMHTAHLFPTAMESFRHLLGLVKNTPELWAEVARVSNAHGAEGIELKNGSRLRFAARGVNGAGRGFSPDDVVFDEAYRLPPEAEEALLYAISAKPNPQLVYASSTGFPDSEILWALVQRGREGSDPSLMMAEWSADPALDLADEDQMWTAVAQANPALGYRLTEQKTSAEYRKAASQNRLEGFGRERLGLWAEAANAGVFSEAAWDALVDTSPELGSPTFGIATAPDRSWSAIAAAWRRPDGNVQVLIGDDYRRDATWVTARAAELRERYAASFVVDDASRGLVPDALEPSKAEQAEAHNALSDAVLAGTVRHGNEPALNVSVRGALWKTSGDTRVLDRKGSTDISPLVAAALAVHGLGAKRAPNIW